VPEGSGGRRAERTVRFTGRARKGAPTCSWQGQRIVGISEVADRLV